MAKYVIIFATGRDPASQQSVLMSTSIHITLLLTSSYLDHVIEFKDVKTHWGSNIYFHYYRMVTQRHKFYRQQNDKGKYLKVVNRSSTCTVPWAFGRIINYSVCQQLLWPYQRTCDNKGDAGQRRRWNDCQRIADVKNATMSWILVWTLQDKQVVWQMKHRKHPRSVSRTLWETDSVSVGM